MEYWVGGQLPDGERWQLDGLCPQPPETLGTSFLYLPHHPPQAAAHHSVDKEEPRFSLSKTLAPGPPPGLPRVRIHQIIFFDNGGI
jgi:hypothetical protein